MLKVTVALLLILAGTAVAQDDPVIDVEELQGQIARNKQGFKSTPETVDAAPAKNKIEQLRKEEQALSLKESELLSRLENPVVEDVALDAQTAPAAEPAVEAPPVDASPKRAIADPVQSDAKVQKTITDLRKQLESAKARERDLKQELAEARNRLLFAETEVERLSNVLEERNRSNLAKFGGSAQVQAPRTAPQAVIAPKAPVTPAEDVPIATVVADKAYLRAGPNKTDSPIMTVAKGTRLTIEKRDGDWYRVYAPNGSRAWISGEVLSFRR